MEIEDIKVFPVNGDSKLKAKANVTFVMGNGARLCVKSFRIHEYDGKTPWVGVPTERVERKGKVEFFEMIWINESGQTQLYQKIIEKYKTQILPKSRTV